MEHNSNGWDEYKRLVISELERANRRLNTVDKRLTHIERNIAILQTKAYVAAGAISIVLSAGISILLKIF